MESFLEYYLQIYTYIYFLIGIYETREIKLI